MKGFGQARIQACSVQTIVNSESHVTVAADGTNQSADVIHLTYMANPLQPKRKGKLRNPVSDAS